MERLNLPDPRQTTRPNDLGATSDPIRQELDDLRHTLSRVSQTCDELRADLDWVAGQVASVRGHVTGGSRRKKQDQEEPAPNGQPTVEQINAAIRAGTFRTLPGR